VALEADGASRAAFAVVELDGGFVARAGAAPGPDSPEVVARIYLAGDLDVVFGGGEGEADLMRVVLVVGYAGVDGRGECGVEGGGRAKGGGDGEEEEGESEFGQHGC